MSFAVTNTSNQQIINHIFNSCSWGSVNHYKVLSVLWLNLGAPWHSHDHTDTVKIEVTKFVAEQQVTRK